MTPTPLSPRPEIPNVAEALKAAVAAIYFDDSSDYSSALWEVVRALSPSMAELLDENPSGAYHRADAAVSQPGEAREVTAREHKFLMRAVLRSGKVVSGQPGEALPAEQPKSDKSYPVVAVGSDLPPARPSSFAFGWNHCVAAAKREPVDFIDDELPMVRDDTDTQDKARIYAKCLRALAKIRCVDMPVAGGRSYEDRLKEAQRQTEWQAANMLEAFALELATQGDAAQREAYAEGRKDEREDLVNRRALIDCPYCNGSGERDVSDTTRGPEGGTYFVNCPDCDGTGFARWPLPPGESAEARPSNKKAPESSSAAPVEAVEVLRAERDEWARKATEWRRLYSELRYPGMTNTVHAVAQPPQAVQEDERDAKRLDWLDARRDTLIDCFMQDGKLTYILRHPWGAPIAHGNSLRAAVDAAIAATTEPKQ